MRVEIPMLPARELNPNYKGHWSRRAKAARELKEAAFYCASNAANLQGVRFSKAKVSITFVVPSWRYIKDPDNALACLKPAIDGCVAAGLIPDDDDKHLSYMLPIMWQRDKEKAPMMILEFKEAK